MPVFNPDGFVLEVTRAGYKADNTPTNIVLGDGQDKWTVRIKPVGWDGGNYSKDVTVDVHFSDGQAKQTFIVPWDTGKEFDVKCSQSRIVQLTFVDKTAGSNYFITKDIQFS